MTALLIAWTLLAGGQTTSDLDTKLASVLPTKEENRWREIPWRTDLGTALKEAEKAKKPLYLWVMDGHPLGCT